MKHMTSHLEKLPLYEKKIWENREILISNIVLLGQIPAPTFEEEERVTFFMDRMAEFQVDECLAYDGGAPVCIIRGKSKTSRPIFIVTNLDAPHGADAMCEYIVTEHAIRGPCERDNSAAAGVMLFLPEILRRLDLVFDSDIVLVGSTESLGRGDQMGIRKLLESRPGPHRGAICLETTELGVIGRRSVGRIRGEIRCTVRPGCGTGSPPGAEAVKAVNEVINGMLRLPLPSEQRAALDFGSLSSGGIDGAEGCKIRVAFEITSESDDVNRGVFDEVGERVRRVARECKVELNLNKINELNAARIAIDHPLVQCAGAVLNHLGIDADTGCCDNAQSIFLSRGTPAVTLGLTRWSQGDRTDATVDIEPMYKGVAQVLGVMKAIDEGVCDE